MVIPRALLVALLLAAFAANAGTTETLTPRNSASTPAATATLAKPIATPAATPVVVKPRKYRSKYLSHPAPACEPIAWTRDGKISGAPRLAIGCEVTKDAEVLHVTQVRSDAVVFEDSYGATVEYPIQGAEAPKPKW